MRKTREEILADVEGTLDLFRKMEANYRNERQYLKDSGQKEERQRDYDRDIARESAWGMAAEELENILERAAG